MTSTMYIGMALVAVGLVIAFANMGYAFVREANRGDANFGVMFGIHMCAGVLYVGGVIVFIIGLLNAVL